MDVFFFSKFAGEGGIKIQESKNPIFKSTRTGAIGREFPAFEADERARR